MAGSSLSAGSFGASWAGGSGFWWTGWGAQCWGKSSKPSSDAGGGESAGFALSFPWEAEVVDEVSGEAELGVGGEGGRSSCSGVRSAGVVQPRVFLRNSEGVFDVEAAQVAPPAGVEVEAGSGGPQPQGLLGRAGGFGQVFHLDPDQGAGHDGRDVVLGPVSPAAESWVQPVPGRDHDGAVAEVGSGRLDVGGGPGVGIGLARAA